jgi:hypothetical protein
LQVAEFLLCAVASGNDIKHSAVRINPPFDQYLGPCRLCHRARPGQIFSQNATVVHPLASRVSVNAGRIIFLPNQLKLHVAPIGDRDREYALTGLPQMEAVEKFDIFDKVKGPTPITCVQCAMTALKSPSTKAICITGPMSDSPGIALFLSNATACIIQWK